MYRITTLVVVGVLTASAAEAQSLRPANDGGAVPGSQTRSGLAATLPGTLPVGAVQRHVDSTWVASRDTRVLVITSGSSVEGGSRGRHAAVGAAIGAVAGLIVYAVDQHACRPENGIPCAVGAGSELMVLVGGGTLVGALVGAVLPHGP